MAGGEGSVQVVNLVGEARCSSRGVGCRRGMMGWDSGHCTVPCGTVSPARPHHPCACYCNSQAVLPCGGAGAPGGRRSPHAARGAAHPEHVAHGALPTRLPARAACGHRGAGALARRLRPPAVRRAAAAARGGSGHPGCGARRGGAAALPPRAAGRAGNPDGLAAAHGARARGGARGGAAAARGGPARGGGGQAAAGRDVRGEAGAEAELAWGAAAWPGARSLGRRAAARHLLPGRAAPHLPPHLHKTCAPLSSHLPRRPSSATLAWARARSGAFWACGRCGPVGGPLLCRLRMEADTTTLQWRLF